MSPDVVDSLPGIVDIVPVFVCSFPPDGGWKVLRENFPSAILRLLDWKYRKSDVNAICIDILQKKGMGGFLHFGLKGR